MRLLSLGAAAAEARRTLLRFPTVLASAAVAAVAGSCLSLWSGTSDRMTAVLVAAALGLPLFTALTLAGERMASRGARLTLQLLGLMTLAGLAWAWLQWSESIQVRRMAQFSLGFHLLVAFLPFLRRGDQNGFWQFNRILFLRFLLSALYTGVLYVGLVLALVAIDQLLKIRVSPKTYMHLWVWLSFVFNTWFFLAGIPADLSSLEERRDYPRGLKAFTQFVLIPLVAIYILILTAYLGRILVTGQWPSGWIGYLVSGVATLGILSLLLVHPIRELEENRWVATYARWFYIAMLPAIAMLLTAIGKRIAQYGLTEDRYFIAVLSMWLTGIALVFIARRYADIRWIPISLCVLTFATAFGPWGAYTVSRLSQLDHLRQLLSRHGMIAGGVARAATSTVPFKTRRELSSTLAYLMGTHGVVAVRPVLGAAAVPDTSDAKAQRFDKGQRLARAAMSRLGIEYVNTWDAPTSSQFWFAANKTNQPALDVSDVDYHTRVSGMIPMTFTTASTSWELRLVPRRRVLELKTANAPVLVFPLDSIIALGRTSGAHQGTTPAPRLAAANGREQALLVPYNFSGSMAADTVMSLSMEADLYLTRNRVSDRPAPAVEP